NVRLLGSDADSMIRRLLALVVALCGLLVAADSPATDRPVALYLVRQSPMDPAAPAAATDIAELELAEAPVLTSKDFVSYDWNRHTLVITGHQWEWAKAVLTGGRPGTTAVSTQFVVLVGDERIYAGYFWGYLSSFLPPPSCPVINVGQVVEEDGLVSLRILAKPEAEGLRGDSRIKAALAEAGVLSEW
ncbi:MAG: hypothetical protein IH621_04600, partial [Krumholzibacteria bacterium]|nr:hypothetical protein [Candidatus Krumholzibacteria bacterium]